MRRGRTERVASPSAADQSLSFLQPNSLQTDRQNEKEKFISIWVRGPSTRNGKPGPLIELIPKFPRGAAKVFSEVWKKQLEGSGSSLIIESSYVHGVYTDPLKRILEWIELCIEEGNDVKFPEVSTNAPLSSSSTTCRPTPAGAPA